VRFALYQDGRNEWRWRLVARNGEIVAIGGEAYASKYNAIRAIETFRAALAAAPVV